MTSRRNNIRINVNLSSLKRYYSLFGMCNLLRFIAAWIGLRKEIALSLSEDAWFFSNVDDWSFYHLANSWNKIQKLVSKIPDDEDFMVLDVGANIGMFSWMVENYKPRAKVHAFEPSPIAFEFLKKNISDNGVLNHVCVGNEICTIDFYEINNSTQISSIYRPTKEAILRNANVIKTPCITLEDYLDKINLNNTRIILKIDVQGYEKQVIEGMGVYFEHISILFLESTWLDISSIEVGLAMAQKCRNFEVINTLTSGADLYLEF